MKKYAINFDLHMDLLTRLEFKFIFKKDINSLYEIINKYLIKYNFEWVQGSGYFTKDKISSVKLSSIITSMYKKYDFLARYTRDIKRTIVDDKTYDYDRLIKNNTKLFYKKYESSVNEFNKQTNTISSAKSIKDKYKDDLLNKNENINKHKIKKIINNKIR